MKMKNKIVQSKRKKSNLDVKGGMMLCGVAVVEACFLGGIQE